MALNVGDRVVVDQGCDVFGRGIVDDVIDLGVGIVLDDSDGSIWRASLNRVRPAV